MAASRIQTVPYFKCSQLGQSKPRNTETAKSAKSCMTVGVIHSRQRTPHSVGRKFPHRNSVICLWKLSKRIRTNHPLTHIAIFKGKRLLKSGKLSIWQLTKVPNWHFATTTISSPTASSQIGNLRYKKMSLYIPSLLSCFYPLLADKVQ